MCTWCLGVTMQCVVVTSTRLHVCFCCILFFFFKLKTAYGVRIRDCSSDVFSSDLLAAISAPISCQRWLCAASSSGAPGSSCSARTLRLRPSTIACAQRSARWLRVSGAASAGWPVGSLGAFMPAIVLQARVRRILGHGTSGDKRARAREERGAQGPGRSLESRHHDLLL